MTVLAFLILLLVGHHAVTRPGLLTAPRQPASWPVRHHPHLAHFLPYLTGDSLRAIRRAGRLRRAGKVWGIDQNGNVTVDNVVFILHWARYRWQYPYVWTGQYRRVLGARVEQRVRVPRSWPAKFHHLTAEQAARLRQLPAGGRRPHRAVAHMQVAAEQNVPWCHEGKGSPGYTQAATWDVLRAEAVATGVTMVFMILTSWPTWREAVRQAVAHDFPVAVLPRTKRPADWHEFAALGVQVWGQWR